MAITSFLFYCRFRTSVESKSKIKGPTDDVALWRYLSTYTASICTWIGVSTYRIRRGAKIRRLFVNCRQANVMKSSGIGISIEALHENTKRLKKEVSEPFMRNPTVQKASVAPLRKVPIGEISNHEFITRHFAYDSSFPMPYTCRACNSPPART